MMGRVHYFYVLTIHCSSQGFTRLLGDADWWWMLFAVNNKAVCKLVSNESRDHISSCWYLTDLYAMSSLETAY